MQANGGGLEPSAIVQGWIFLTSLTDDVTSEIAEDNWEQGCNNISSQEIELGETS